MSEPRREKDDVWIILIAFLSVVGLMAFVWMTHEL